MVNERQYNGYIYTRIRIMFYWKGDIQSLHFFTLRGRKQQRTSLWSFDVKEMEGNNKIVRAWKTIQHCNEGRHLSIGWRFLVPVLLHIRFSCERSRTARNNLKDPRLLYKALTAVITNYSKGNDTSDFMKALLFCRWV